MGVPLFHVGVSMGDAVYLRIATATQSLKWLDKLGGHSSFKAEIVRSQLMMRELTCDIPVYEHNRSKAKLLVLDH